MDAAADFEGRLVRLEEDLCFLGEEVGKLEASLTGQQRQLDELLKEAREVKLRMQHMLALLGDDLAPSDGVPPHYLEHFWREKS